MKLREIVKWVLLLFPFLSTTHCASCTRTQPHTRTGLVCLVFHRCLTAHQPVNPSERPNPSACPDPSPVSLRFDLAAILELCTKCVQAHVHIYMYTHIYSFTELRIFRGSTCSLLFPAHTCVYIKRILINRWLRIDRKRKNEYAYASFSPNSTFIEAQLRLK